MPKSPVRRAEHRRTATRLLALDDELRPYLAEVAAARAALLVRTGDDVTLDERRAAHRRLRFMAERDELTALPIGSLQAVDTGMSGPAIGFHLHGRSTDPGTPARYGLDLEATLRSGEGDAELVAEAQAPAREELVTAS